jgi:transcriptional/translational regulatory protein YebC/TACO1
MITVRKALQDAGFDYESAETAMVPNTTVSLDLDGARKVVKLIDNLDDLDDVQNIYANWTAPDDVMEQLDAEG